MARPPHHSRIGLSLRHPLIVLRAGGAGDERPAPLGSRLYIWQIVDTVRGNGDSVSEAAAYLGLPDQHVQAARDYYAEFTAEIDSYRSEEQAFAQNEPERSDPRGQCCPEPEAQ
jgi:uncharacterized protein (DUF433 family)